MLNFPSRGRWRDTGRKRLWLPSQQLHYHSIVWQWGQAGVLGPNHMLAALHPWPDQVITFPQPSLHGCCMFQTSPYSGPDTLCLPGPLLQLESLSSTLFWRDIICSMPPTLCAGLHTGWCATAWGLLPDCSDCGPALAWANQQISPPSSGLHTNTFPSKVWV